jgi:hypothetical protein
VNLFDFLAAYDRDPMTAIEQVDESEVWQLLDDLAAHALYLLDRLKELEKP